jgi:hypothetical protein
MMTSGSLRHERKNCGLLPARAAESGLQNPTEQPASLEEF